MRVDGDQNGRDKQLKLINEFCQEHGCEVVKVFQDDGPTPGSALSLALQALNQADGLIAVDLNRFVHHHGDRMRDLKPFIHNFFCHTERYLLTVTEGIDTSSPVGQKNAVEFFSNVKDFG